MALNAQYLQNKQEIIALLQDPRYRYCLGFYGDTVAPMDPTGYQLHGLLPQLWWPITRLRVHPTGLGKDAHWRLSLHTADGKRTFFNNTIEYLSDGYGQMRIGPGRDNMDAEYGFDLALSPGVHTLRDFLDAALDPPANVDDGVVEHSPMCWFFYPRYPSVGECRHWAQACARAFFSRGLLAQDPTPVLEQNNRRFGYPVSPETPSNPIPHGTFFAVRPAETITLSVEPKKLHTFLPSNPKGRNEQEHLAAGFPNFT